MSKSPVRKYRRPRLDAAAHARLLEEIAKFDTPPVSVQIAETMSGLREALAVPVDDEIPVDDAPPSGPVPPTEPDPEPESEDAASPGPTDATPEPSIVDEPMGSAPPVVPVEDTAEPIAPSPPDRTTSWNALRRVPVDGALLDRNLIITASRTDPAHASFDVMRTRLKQALAEKGWRRVAITSPTKGCGKSFTAANLAVTLSRYDGSRTLLLDMDLRHPSLARYIGVTAPGSIGDVLRGHTAMADHLCRPGKNTLHIGEGLALALNDRPENFAAELLQQDTTARALHRMEEDFGPDVILYDLPPALAYDDVMAFRPHFDCVLLVVGGGITNAADVKEVHRRLGDDKPVMGVILNMAEDNEDNTY